QARGGRAAAAARGVGAHQPGAHRAPRPRHGHGQALARAVPRRAAERAGRRGGAMTPRKKRRARPRPPTISRWVAIRIRTVAVLLSLGFAGLAFNAYGLQIDEGAHYRELAAR